MMNPRRFLSREAQAEDTAAIPDDGSGDNSSDRIISSFHTNIGSFPPQHPRRQQQYPFPPVSPQNSTRIIDEDERLRQQEQRRSIRRMRLVIRPAVILVLGFFVFRNTNNRGFFRTTFGNRSRSNNNNKNGLRLRKQFVTDQENYGTTEFSSKTVVGMASTDTDVVEEDSNCSHNLAITAFFPFLFGGGNPTTSVYNFVTGMNDDDSNDDLPDNRVPLNGEAPPTETADGDGDVNQGVPVQSKGDRKPHDPGSSGSHKSKDDGTNNNSDNNEDDKSNSDSESNPSSYGWVPDVYPDPWIDPVRCGIAYLLQPHPEGLPAEEERRGGLVFEDANNNATEPATRTSDLPLRLCDPDWVLGGTYLEEIAQKMQDFSNRFTTDDLEPIVSSGDPRKFLPEKQRGLALAVATVRKVGAVDLTFLLS
jgi:hypothetical protein